MENGLAPVLNFVYYYLSTIERVTFAGTIISNAKRRNGGEMGILLTEMTEADAAAAGNSFGLGMMVVIYGLFFVAMYFLMMRPQKKEQKRVAAMIAALELGDYVLTTSGFYGSVIDINDDTVIVEFGNNKNCRIPMDKSAISRVEKPEGN